MQIKDGQCRSLWQSLCVEVSVFERPSCAPHQCACSHCMCSWAVSRAIKHICFCIPSLALSWSLVFSLPPSKMAQTAAESSPAGKKTRACLNCSLVQTVQEFKDHGCPNCPFLSVNKNRNIGYTTSPSFKGAIFLMDPKHSWIAKWQRIGQYRPGVYAMTVEGVLSDKFIDDIEKEGRVYINRSSSFELE